MSTKAFTRRSQSVSRSGADASKVTAQPPVAIAESNHQHPLGSDVGTLASLFDPSDPYYFGAEHGHAQLCADGAARNAAHGLAETTLELDQACSPSKRQKLGHYASSGNGKNGAQPAFHASPPHCRTSQHNTRNYAAAFLSPFKQDDAMFDQPGVLSPGFSQQPTSNTGPEHVAQGPLSPSPCPAEHELPSVVATVLAGAGQPPKLGGNPSAAVAAHGAQQLRGIADRCDDMPQPCLPGVMGLALPGTNHEARPDRLREPAASAGEGADGKPAEPVQGPLATAGAEGKAAEGTRGARAGGLRPSGRSSGPGPRRSCAGVVSSIQPLGQHQGGLSSSPHKQGTSNSQRASLNNEAAAPGGGNLPPQLLQLLLRGSLGGLVRRQSGMWGAREQKAAQTITEAQEKGEQVQLLDDVMFYLDDLSPTVPLQAQRDGAMQLLRMCSSKRGLAMLKTERLLPQLLQAFSRLVPDTTVDATGSALQNTASHGFATLAGSALLLNLTQPEPHVELLSSKEALRLAAAGLGCSELVASVSTTRQGALEPLVSLIQQCQGCTGIPTLLLCHASTLVLQALAACCDQPSGVPPLFRKRLLQHPQLCSSIIQRLHWAVEALDRCAVRHCPPAVQADHCQAASLLEDSDAEAAHSCASAPGITEAVWVASRCCVVLENLMPGPTEQLQPGAPTAHAPECAPSSNIHKRLSISQLPAQWARLPYVLVDLLKLVTPLSSQRHAEVCLRSCLALLMNLAHWGEPTAQQLVQQGVCGHALNLMHSYVAGEAGLKAAAKFSTDSLCLCLGLLINLMEVDPGNRQVLLCHLSPDAAPVHAAEGTASAAQQHPSATAAGAGTVPRVVQLLCALRQQALLVVERQPAGADGSDGIQQHGELSWLQLEDQQFQGLASMVEAYVCVALAFLASAGQQTAALVASQLPDGSLQGILESVDRCLTFYTALGAMSDNSEQRLRAVLDQLQRQHQDLKATGIMDDVAC